MHSDADDLLPERARRQMGSFLASFQWDFFVTLTTSTPLTAEAVDRAVRHGFVRSLTQKAQRSVSYFYGIEGGEPVGGFHHVHALVFTGGILDVRSVARSWRRGFTDVRRYDPRRGAAWYVSKGMQPDRDHYALSRRMPPRVDSFPELAPAS